HPVMQGGVSQFEKSVSHVFKSHKDCSNRVKLVQKSSIPAPAHPKDDYLIVQCTITVLKERTDVAAAVPVPASNLPQHFGDLLQRGTGADITFVVSGESFAAHKVILAARSPVLMAEFFGYMREASAQSIMIKDMEAAVFKAMLHFIYTDTVPELDRELEAVETMAQHLLVAADRRLIGKVNAKIVGYFALIDHFGVVSSTSNAHACRRLHPRSHHLAGFNCRPCCTNCPAPPSVHHLLTPNLHFLSVCTPSSPACAMVANTCTNLTDTARFERLFKIDGFSLVSSTLGSTELIKSNAIHVDGYEWEIHCFPRAWYSNWYVALKLMFLSDAPRTGAVTASLSCLLVHPRMVGNAPHSEKNLAHVFRRHKDCSNTVLLVQRDSLMQPACPRDDYLTVRCTSTVLKEPPAVATTVPVPTANLHKHLSELLCRGTGADVTFSVGSEKFAAHNAILAARSPVLMAEFFGQTREATSPCVVIEDMEVAAFKAMLCFDFRFELFFALSRDGRISAIFKNFG
ncbi:hypothetical protein CFC21_104928, partial [Triticum aestivum]